MDTNLPQDVKEAAERSDNRETIISRIWPPSGQPAKADELYNTLRKEGEDVEKPEIIEIFKELDKKGYGDYIVGRRGWSTRIEWNEHARNLPREENYSTRKESIANSIEHKFILRPGFEVFLILPEDLSSKEARRLSNFVETLPFDNERG